MKNYFYSINLKAITQLAIILLLFTVSSYSQTGWFSQPLPVSGQINDMVFFDANTGIIAMNSTPPYILRTTNGGTNWNIGTSLRVYFLDKIDSMAVYGNGNNSNSTTIYRSYDRGLTWDSTEIIYYYVIQSISFFDRDTGLISGFNGDIDVIWKTTNGGRSMSVFSTQTGFGRLSFLKPKYNGEYYGFHISSSSGSLFKSTNSGLNWINVPNPLGSGNFNSIFFVNKDTGWTYIANNPSRFMFSSNGGSTWVTQYIDSSNSYSKILFANKSKGWAGKDGYRIFATSNGGITWGTQIIPIYYGMPFPNSFVDSLQGWIGGSGINIAKTTNGGGVITYIGIDSNNSIIPSSYILHQNYPNPFNPSTKISFSIIKENYVTLKIFDITGKEILILYNNKFLPAGNYKARIDFNRIYVPSGIYFCILTVFGKSNSAVFIETKKMLYLK